MSLLRSDYKKAVKREKILRLSACFFFLLSFAGILGIVFMLPSYFSLVFSKDDYLRQLAIEEEILARKEAGKLEEEISKINDAINLFEANEKKRRSISDILVRLFRLTTPSEIRIFNMNLVRGRDGEFTLGLQGNADTREIFLRYVSALESSPDYSGVSSPITNLLSESNIDFKIDLRLKPEVYGL